MRRSRRTRQAALGRGGALTLTVVMAALLATLLILAASSPVMAQAAQDTAPSPGAVREVPADAVAAPAPPAGDGSITGGWDLSIISRIWSFPLFTVASEPVTTGQLVTVTLMAVLGLWLSVIGTKMLRRYLLRTGRLTANAAGIVSNLVFYLLVIIVVLQAMMMVNIPLATFAFLGGAMAIGLGFGAQNILNNFISGLILMLERPIRIGDLIEVDGNLGTVEHIGGRCTRVRRVDGIDTLVPNSTLLENNVVNWTLSDRDVRTSVAVGVAYGSPVRQVADLIRQAVDEEKEALRQPEPLVLFQDFGDNALAFEAFFWVRVGRPMDMRRVRSEVRFRIDDLFREAGIVIAFPQRDVHLDSAGPVRVQLVGDGRRDEADE